MTAYCLFSGYWIPTTFSYCSYSTVRNLKKCQLICVSVWNLGKLMLWSLSTPFQRFMTLLFNFYLLASEWSETVNLSIGTVFNYFLFQEFGHSPDQRHSACRHCLFDWPYNIVRDWLNMKADYLFLFYICFFNLALSCEHYFIITSF